MDDFVVFQRYRIRYVVLVNRHEHTAKSTSDVRFSLFARSSLWEHLSHFSAASVEEIGFFTPPPPPEHIKSMMLTATNVNSTPTHPPRMCVMIMMRCARLASDHLRDCGRIPFETKRRLVASVDALLRPRDEAEKGEKGGEKGEEKGRGKGGGKGKGKMTVKVQGLNMIHLYHIRLYYIIYIFILFYIV